MAIELGFKDDAPEMLDTRVRDTLKVLDGFYDMFADDVVEAARLLALAFLGEQRVLTAGLGVSASVAAMMPLRFTRAAEGREPRSVVALSAVQPECVVEDDIEGMRANLFLARQVLALGNDGDVLILFTVDGNHPALLEAARAAREQNMFVLGLTAGDGGRLADEELLDLELRVPSIEDGLVHETHLNLVFQLEELASYYLYSRPEILRNLMKERAGDLLP